MSKFKRLIKADNLNNVYKNIFKNLGKDGREVLKQIENYKYKISQNKEILSDEKSSKQLDKCIEDLNNVSAFMYSFIFDLENFDIVDDYDKQIEFSLPKEETDEEDETNIDNNETNDESQNNEEFNNVENEEMENEDESLDEENFEENEEEINEDSKNMPENFDDLFEDAKENDEKLE